MKIKLKDDYMKTKLEVPLKLMSIMLISALLWLSFCACSGKRIGSEISTKSEITNGIIGSYYSAGDRLEIYENGTCQYYDAGWLRTNKGTWEIEGDKIIFHGISQTTDTLYADISDFCDLLVVEADGGGWVTETFKKTS